MKKEVSITPLRPLKLAIFGLCLMPTICIALQGTEEPNCGNNIVCLKSILSQIEGEVQRLQDSSEHTTRQLSDTNRELNEAKSELARAKLRLSSAEQQLTTQQKADSEKDPVFEPLPSPNSSTATNTNPPISTTPGKANTSQSKSTENPPSGIGSVSINDVLVGIYRIEPQVPAVDAPYFGQRQFRLIFSPHVFPGEQRLPGDREFFLSAKLPNPDKEHLIVRQASENPVKIFPIQSEVSIIWRISRRDLIFLGTTPTTLQAQLGSRRTGKQEPVAWDKSRPPVVLVPELSINAPDPIKWIKGNIELIAAALGVIGTGGILGIWKTARSQKESDK